MAPKLNMPLTPSQRRYLRQLAHPLKPVLMVGAKGVTDAVCNELEVALRQHELLKIRLGGGDRQQRADELARLLESSGAAEVQTVGHVASVYRAHPEQPRLALPR